MKLPETATANVRNMRWHAGSLIRMLATSNDTRGEMTGVEVIVRRGLEPPTHTHAREDEAVYILAGEVQFTIGRKRVLGREGEWILLPRGVRHSCEVMGDQAHLLVTYTPGGIEGFFEALSEPAEDSAIPPGTLCYESLFDMEYIMHVGRQFGIRFHPSRPAALLVRRAAA
jgi:quercetin dioxygenase-like cupin family protein